MIQDMKKTLTRLFTVALLLMVSLGARAEVKVLFGVNGTELQPDKYGKVTLGQKELTGGTVIISQEDQKNGTTELTLAVTPDKGYRLAENGLEVYTVAPADISQTRTVKASTKLDIKSEDFKDEASKRTYTATIDSKLALWLKSANFLPQKRENGAKDTGDPDFSGVWYIANETNHSSTTISSHWYLVPGADPQQSHYADAYFHNQYCNTSGKGDYTGDNYGDSEKPFLTTYQTNRDLNSIWIVVSTGDGYYNIIHAKTGKYIVYEPPYKEAQNRKSMHLESTTTPGDNAKFTISGSSLSSSININPKNVTSGNMYFNPAIAQGNYPRYYGTGTYFHEGMIGLYSASNDKSQWYFEDASSATTLTPVISDVDGSTNTFTITSPAAAFSSIRYTTDGSTTPNASTGNTVASGSPITITSTCNVQAVGVFGTTFVTPVAGPKELSPVATPPTISYNNATGLVTISSAAALSYYYTTNGDTPTTSTGTLYETPFPVTTATTVKAIAIYAGSVASEPATLEITQVATPTIQKNGSNAISITTTVGATIYYTTDGSTPTPGADGTFEYTDPLTENVSNVTIKAIAVKEGMITSAVGSGKVMLQCATPVITRDGLKFTLSCSMPTDATFYYSLDGSTPETLYNGPVSFTSELLPMTVKAVARHNEYTESEIVSVELRNGSGTAADPYVIYGATDFANFIADVNAGTTFSACYKLGADVSGSGVDAITRAFTGTFDGGMHIISDLGHALFNTVTDGVVKNVILDNVGISGGTNVGAICNEATGDTRIYNCGILATNSTVEKDDDGYDHISSSSSTISGSGYVGSIVGLLDGTSRVINCFSYADVSGGSEVGGIVGHNNVATTSAADNLKTMVMNCMFYGEVSGGSIAPIYNGEIITNDGDANGVNNFNYFRLESSYIQNTGISKVYNCALGAETRFLQRFEFYRHLLNSNRELAAWWAMDDADKKDEIMKWVMEPSQIGTSTPYPILKTPNKYASVVNYTPSETAYDEENRNKGRKLTNEGDGGVLHVTIQMGSGGAQYNAPSGAGLKSGVTGSFDLTITDKDFEHFNFNYGKVQLPYYNDYCDGNYTGYRVVTGWKIVSITGGTTGSYSIGDDVTYTNGKLTSTPYNFADRQCTNKDLYGTNGSNRVFNQGAYWDVPEGVTAITIEPYWGKAVYLADAYWDVVYKNGTGSDITKAGSTIDAMTSPANVPNVGGGQHYGNGESFNNQIVFTSISDAISSSIGNGLFNGATGSASHTVYDYAVVLVGNYHHTTTPEAGNGKPYTVTSVDLDGDNEPDYSLMLRFNGRTGFHPVRYDFLNLIGLGMAQKATGGIGSYNLGIMQPKYWFEVTNTALFRVTQFEYSPATREKKPIILQGGVIEQWVTQQQDAGDRVEYFHVGGNVWFKEFHRGSHQDNDNKSTPHPPVSVTGGDFNKFYLTGYYQSKAAIYDDNAECYINGGRFGEVAGAGMEGIGTSDGKGNITWIIDNADIKEFYGGGINFAKPVHGNIHTIISNSHVDQFCGGPKFGDMKSDRTVTTTATDCTFGTYFGAGFGGSSYNRQAPYNHNNIFNFPHNGGSQAGNDASWNAWLQRYYKQAYNATYGGVSTQFDYQFLPMSTNTDNVARIFVEYVAFSKATTHDVTSSLTGCTITGNFYGGGSLGMVDGDVTSTLTNCTVNGSVFGAGYSASIPTVEVMSIGFATEPYYYEDLGTYRMGVFPTPTTTYRWEHGNAISVDNTNHILYTTEDLTTLGQVTGKVTMNIKGNTLVKGNVFQTDNNGNVLKDEFGNNLVKEQSGGVFGGGDASAALGDTEVNINATGLKTGYAYNTYNVFGGGNLADVGGSVTVNMIAGTVDKDVYGGGALANTNNYDPNDYEEVSVTPNVTVVTGYYTKSGNSYTMITAANQKAAANTTYYKKGKWVTTLTNNTTTVNLLGGEIDGDAYGGGLGRIGVTGSEAVYYNQLEADAYNTEHNLQEGDEGYVTTETIKTPAVAAVSEVKATVYGDITVILGKDDASSATKFNIDKYTDEQHAGVVKSGRVFGCNNLNGSPQGDVTVTVYTTVAGSHDKTPAGSDGKAPKTVSSATSYRVAAVYGGGNLANYAPTSTGKKTHVIINGCDETSIEYVYGGGNAAAVPETDVDINEAYEIGTVFGGGNGKDQYTLDGGTTWKDNAGADVNGKTNTMLYGGTIHEAFGGSNEKGTISGSVYINTSTCATCPLNVGKLYGAGKNADINGDLIMVLGCKEARTEEVYGGAENANVKGNVELTITSGEFGKVFGGNNQSGAIFGHIKLNIQETSCTPIKIDELYLGGNEAAYSIYGYYIDGTNPITGKPLYKPRSAEMHNTATTDLNYHPAEDNPTVDDDHPFPYDDPELNIISCESIGMVFGGGFGVGAALYGNPTVNINQTYPLEYDETTKAYKVKRQSLGAIGGGYEKNSAHVDGGVFGGGNEATVYGNTTVNIGTETSVNLIVFKYDANGQPVVDGDDIRQTETITGQTFNKVLGANIVGNVYGGGNLADVTGITQVNICAKEVTSGTTTSWQSVILGTAGVAIAGNVYGGGKGVASESGDRAFYCEEAMVGIDGTNSADNNNSSTYADYGTHVRIGNGTIGNGTTGGNVYGGGEIGRVEFHTEVVIGLGAGTGAAAKSPVINGSVFGAGKGTNTHGYSGLVRGDSRVTIQGDAKVGHSVYGGGEMASIGKYELDANGLPKTPKFGGKCTVTIQGYAEIGPDNMQMTKEGGPDDTGHVFGAGKGTLPYENVTGTPWSMELTGKVNYDEGKESDYYKFIQSLGLASNSDVTIGGNAFVKGSVYGGSENGYLQANTHVTIAGGQVGAGYDKEQNKSLPKYAETAFIDPSNSETPVTESNALATCATWTYDKTTTGNPYDKYAGTAGYDAKGGATTATDGHTYYGNVFGGGRGVVPFAAGKWHRAAGSVAGNTQLDITAGHILSSVYGGNENTDVGSYALGTDGEPTTTLSSGGTCTINITGGTVGVPRTKEQIEDNPVIGNVFGAGKGDKRVLFNTWTNVGATSVNISGDAIIYGSVFGGGEDGHVINNAVTNIGGTVTTGVVGKTSEHTYTKVVIGSTGISGADGNVFGGGRGSVTALTAGVVGGNANLTINKGIIMGNVYGGGRLASVGTNFTNPTLENGEPDPRYGELQTPDADHGNIIVTVNDGTIGSSTSTGVNGNIFGGSKGTETNWKLGIARSTTVNMTGGTAYASVYGGGELAQVVGSHTTNGQVLGTEVNISGGTIGIQGKGRATWGNVYAGGKGNTTHVEAGLVKTNTKANISQAEGKTTTIYHNIYGGGAYGSVGTFDLSTADNLSTYQVPYAGMPVNWATGTGTANVTITGGTIGTDGKENGMVFGSSRGDIAALGEIHDKLAWVNNVNITVGTDGSETGPQIKGSVYGSGENGHTYNNTEVTVYSGTIGIANSSDPGYSVTSDGTTYSGAEYPYRGNVYGGGCGTDKYYSGSVPEGHTANDGEGNTYNSLAGIVYGTTTVTIDGGHVVRNVYGAGAMGSVGKFEKNASNNAITFASGGKTTIAISGGTIGVDGTNGDGNVFGAARGDASSAQTDVALVKTTDVTISGDATIVWGNVYGGGQIGCVGTFDETDGKYVWSSGGLSKVTVSGGKIGPDNNDNPEIGNVFGAGKGKANTFKCEKAMVRETIVSISDGTVNGNVYGGGEIGRVEENTEVTIGRKSGEAEGAGTGKPIINGSVFGAGKGKETHGYSALVRGNTTVTVEGATGAKVGNSVYGGGEIASVGRYGLDNKKMPEILVDGGYCYVKVLGNVVIGPSNASDDKGNVFGAGKGVNPAYVYKTSDRENNSKRMVTYDPTGRHQTGQGTLWDPYDDPDDPNDDPTHPNFVWEYFMGNATTGVSGEDEFKNYLETLALATHPEVTIGGNATVNSSVFGGGELGLTKGSVVVSIRGGTVVKDVYGGGSLANTNTTSTWAKRDAEGKPLPPDEHGNYAVDEVKIHPTTTVNLLGGSLRDAYGGGLGRLASTGVSAVEAFVYGDVKVELNNNNNGSTAVGTSKGCIVNRIFGCNNLNGSPKAKVQVYVYATQNRGQSTISGKTKGTYDVQAVYGGGNLSAYEPDDALLEYTDANKATVDAARTEVYIDGCDLTSIKQVYGGGNAASVPATYVLVNRAFEIDEVFGGGNGADDYSLTNGTNTVWYKNPGANVGYYDYTRLVTDQDKGEDGKFIGTGSGTEADPYKNIDKENARTKVNRQNPDNHYMYGSGIATTEIKGGTIHTVYGGSNSRGNVRTKLSSSYSGMFDDCPMVINTTYGSGKNAESDGEVEVLSDCAKGISVMFGGAENADVDNDINLIITNGSSLQRVFGGNNTSGAINGSITVTIKEGGCEPIRIGELYAGGFLAPYSIYGYKKTNGVYDTEEVEYFDENDNTVKKKLQRIPLESASEDVTPKANPRINVISATRIDNIFGGGYQAKLVGSPHINVNMEPGRILAKYVKEDFVGEHKDTDGNVLWTGDHIVTEDGPEKGDGILAIGTIGNVYGGGNMADIVGNTYVEIGTGTEHNDAGELVAITPVRNAATITGNVFGGGKGKADTFLCEKAMIGKDGDGVNNPDGGTHVTIGNGTVDGNVYGGGEIGRVEKNTVVTIGIGDGVAPDGTPTSAPEIKGSVFGGGKGKETHGYAALVRGNPTVIIQGNAKVGHSVYGGGEIASVARYKVAKTNEEAAANGVEVDMPYVLANNTSGKCIVKVLGYAEIGPDDMKMYHDNIAVDQDKPDDWGHVFGAGKGIMPEGAYDYVNGVTKRMVSVKDAQGNIIGSDWEYFADEATYITFIQTLALASKTDVTIGDHAFVKGSVYGGSENGLVQFDTDVKIQDECQIGNGDGVNRRYTTDEWAYDGSTVARSLKECAHWDYGREEGTGENKKTIYAPYDPNANATGNLDKYSNGKSTEGGRRIATDGHTYYGNVFGGGSGSVPYFDAEEGISKYLNSAGTVKGNTKVTISGGHILTNVYGGCEATNVLGKATVKMTNGTIGVPRTAQQIKDHPVTCYLFGAGKGDQRIYFNKETNVNDAIVNVEGGRIYGSVFGGGEDGHVLRNTTVTIGKTDGTGPKIGTVGSTYVDGNVFGGGRGFGGEALTAGNVGGTVDLTINGGEMLGSIYGGGRLASVGYGLYLTTEKGFGANNDDGYGKMQDDGYSDWTKGEDGQYTRTEISGFKRGYITVTVNGGTIGSDVEDEHSGNVFGGSMGRLAKIDGSPFDDQNHWALLATAKTTEVNVTGGIIKRNVYGGGEMGTVIEKATVNISGGTIGKSGGDNVEIGNVFGGGKGYLDPAQTYVGAGIVKGNTNVTIKNGASGGTTTTPTIYQNVYGGGELGYVGMFTTPDHKEYTWTENTGLCTVGVAGGTITGHVFGAGKGKDDTFECERAMVRTTSVAVGGGKVGGNVYGGGEVGRVDQNSAVTIGSATGDSAPTITGSVFGAGAGVETHGYSALVRGNTAVIVQGNAKVGNSVYGGGQIAAVGRYGLDSSGMPSTLVSGGECVVTVQGNAVIGTNGTGNVFGAGMGVDESKKTYTYADNANRPKRMMTFASGLYTDANKELWEYSDDTHTYVWEYFDTREKYLNFLQTLALATDTRLTINGNASANGSVYGGSESGFVQRYTDVRILGGKIQTIADASGKITEGNVFGGGKGISDNDAAGRVRSDTKVTVLGGTVYGDVYGGGALGKANTLEATNTASVNLLGGVIEGNAFGGGLGNATTAADVGNTRVNLNGMTDEEINGFSDNDFKTLLNTTLSGLKEYSKKGAVVKGSVFGANNVNGTPKGHVLVHVYATQNKDLATIKDKKVITSDEPTASDFDVTGVFGGGKQADYVPELTDAMQSTEVIIEGCDLTSIYEVYGGGYGAATPGTNVLVKGTNIINNVFGGGYGAGNHTDTSAADYNPGANVGFRSDGTTAYGSGGKAVVQLMAGTVNHVYGGSNTLGNIRGRSNVTSVVKGTGDVSPGCCDHLTVLDIFGGGKSAEMFGGTEVVLGCMPDDWIGAIYAGAEAADVHNDVSLTLTSGKFERVFGGNKSSGTIDGYIEVNIEENPECSTPIIIGGLYGGGNEAPYTYPLLDKDPNYLSPRVNVRAFTSIGNIYGGGFGATATVTGNPLVNINVVEGGREYAGEDKPLEDGTTVTLHARSKDAKMGVIGNVFGGGNAAKVIGNPRVEVGTAAKQKMLSLQTKDAAGTVHEVEKDVLGADIRGNVYGGGNNAAVTGHTNVVIGKKAE